MRLPNSPIENTPLSHSSSQAVPDAGNSLAHIVKSLGLYLLGKAGVNSHGLEPQRTAQFPKLVLSMPPEIIANIIRLADPETQKNIRLACISDIQLSVLAATQKLWINNRKDLDDMLETYKYGGIDEITITSTQFSKSDLLLLKNKGVNVKHVNLNFADSEKLTNRRLEEIATNIPAPIKIKSIDVKLSQFMTPAGLHSILQKISQKQGFEPNVQKFLVSFRDGLTQQELPFQTPAILTHLNLADDQNPGTNGAQVP